MLDPKYKVAYDPNDGTWNVQELKGDYAGPSEMSYSKTWKSVHNLGRCLNEDEAIAKFQRWIRGPASTTDGAYFDEQGNRVG